jgi:hypothetical protein
VIDSRQSSDLVRPAYGVASLADVMPGTLASLGVPGATDPLGLASHELAGVTGVAVLLVDGLGHHLLPMALPYAPTIADIVTGRMAGASARAITTGFPSTTPASLATLTTGSAPGAHGIVGIFLNIPGTEEVLNLLRWRNEPDPLRWQPLTTQFARAAQAGVFARAVSRPEFADGGLTAATLRGAEYVGSSDVDDTVERVLDGLTRRPSIVYTYLADVDRAGHEFGVDSPQWREAVGVVDDLVTRLVDGLPPGTALLITADHGQLNVPADHRFDLDTDLRLREGVRVVAGEARVRYLHTQPGAAEDVRSTWSGVLGDAATVMSRDEAIADGWFGPVAEEHLQRVGDVVAVCHGEFAVLATTSEPKQLSAMIGFHGSATEAEMRIPLLIVRR